MDSADDTRLITQANITPTFLTTNQRAQLGQPNQCLVLKGQNIRDIINESRSPGVPPVGSL